MLNVVDKAEHYLGTLQAAGAEQEDGTAGWEPVDKGLINLYCQRLRSVISNGWCGSGILEGCIPVLPTISVCLSASWNRSPTGIKIAPTSASLGQRWAKV